MKSIFYTIGGFILLGLGYWYYTSIFMLPPPNGQKQQNFESTTGAKVPLGTVTVSSGIVSTSGSQSQGIVPSNTGSGSDRFLILQNTNLLFGQAVELSKNKDYTGALDLLEKAKNIAKSNSERAIIDFNIASNRFVLNRLDGARYYTDLAKNPNYEARVRALSMQRIYLLYRKYGDIDVLRTTTDAMGIVWISEDQAKLEYMKKAYALYPLPGSALFLMQTELTGVSNKSDAEAIYQKYMLAIDAGIVAMQQYEGELTEATSAMLSRANILGDLYRDYAISSRETIEQFYRDLIQFDQAKGLNVNKQYSLVYYANFLADINDVVAAQNIIKILLEDSLESALNEGLPKTKNLSALRTMTPITDKSVQDFITFLGPIIQ